MREERSLSQTRGFLFLQSLIMLIWEENISGQVEDGVEVFGKLISTDPSGLVWKVGLEDWTGVGLCVVFSYVVTQDSGRSLRSSERFIWRGTWTHEA